MSDKLRRCDLKPGDCFVYTEPNRPGGNHIVVDESYPIPKDLPNDWSFDSQHTFSGVQDFVLRISRWDTRYGGKRSVLQDWTHQITFMQQSVLITATRGPDGIRKDHPVKVLLRYLRRSFLICAFDGRVRWSPYEPGGGSFTGPLNLNGTGPNDGHLDKFVEIYLRHVDELPHHFQLHYMHAAEILGYKHPDSDVRGFWRAMYLAIVKDAHLSPESEATMDHRLGDVENQWREAEGGVTAF